VTANELHPLVVTQRQRIDYPEKSLNELIVDYMTAVEKLTGQCQSLETKAAVLQQQLDVETASTQRWFDETNARLETWVGRAFNSGLALLTLVGGGLITYFVRKP